MSGDPPLLDYCTPGTPVPGQHSKALAFLLCAPGTFALALLFLDSPSWLSGWIDPVAREVFWPLFILAVVSAVASLLIYTRYPLRSLPWHVRLNLAINVSGLVIAVLCIPTFIVCIAIFAGPIYCAMKGWRWWLFAEGMKWVVVIAFLAIDRFELLYDWQGSETVLSTMALIVFVPTVIAGVILVTKTTRFARYVSR